MDEIHYLLGNSCNLNCDFCFWDTRMSDISLDIKNKIINQIAQSGIKKVTISGGEPFCNDNLLEVLEYLYKQKVEIILHSNGLKINKFLAQKVAPFISRISLTMDAIDINTQILMRKNSNITDHTIFLIQTFHDLNIPVNIKTLVTKINKNEIVKIGNILNRLPIKYWSLLEFIPLNRGAINQNNFLLKNNEFDRIYSEIKGAFPSMDIRIRKFDGSDNNYCFIASNGDVYTYLKNKGDVLIGNVINENLSSLIKKIEK